MLAVVFAGFQTAKAEWRKQHVDTLAWLHSVYFIDKDTGWIGGSKGTFLKTVDGGRSWNKQPTFTQDIIRDVFFSDKNTGWLLCERDIYSLGRNTSSYLLKTSSGGGTWEKVEFENNQRQRITRIFFAANGYGMAIGETGALFGLLDDTRTWKKLTPPTRYLMADGAFLDDLQAAVVGGGGTILFTEDAGTTWNKAFVSGKPASRLNAVFFNNSRVGWAVGSDGKILQTINGGKLWRHQRSVTSDRLNDVFFLNSAEGWVVGDNGVMLHTTTAGNVWRKAASISGHKLESLFFSGDRGWAVGFGGTILIYEKS